jgi:hypothetical protein
MHWRALSRLARDSPDPSFTGVEQSARRGEPGLPHGAAGDNDALCPQRSQEREPPPLYMRKCFLRLAAELNRFLRQMRGKTQQCRAGEK